MLRWYLHRLAAMNPAETRHRIRRAWRNRRDRTRFASGGPEAIAGSPPQIEIDGNSPWLFTSRDLAERAREIPPSWRARTLREADEILSGVFRWFDEDHDLGDRPDWNTEPLSGVAFPTVHWSRLAAISPEGRYDIKHLWELNIHPCFPTLAKAFLLTGDSIYRDRLTVLWTDWMDQSPPLAGPNYLAPLAVGLRLLHWIATLRFWGARERPPQPLQQRILEHVHYQRHQIATNLSLFSSANNHLIAELTCLILVDLALPGIGDPEDGPRFQAELERQILLQFAEDGGNREQAFHYHSFALAFALLAVRGCRAAGRPVASATVERLEAARRFLRAGLDRSGRPFLYGDADESQVLPLAEENPDPYAALLSPDLSVDRTKGNERAFWLTGDRRALPAAECSPGEANRSPADPSTMAESASSSSSASEIRLDVFETSGHAFYRGDAIDLHFNGGALGYLSIAAHAHADALALAIRYRGEPVVVDPGTYTYRGGDPWRDFLVSSAAHATVTLGNRSFADRRGPFLWSRPYRRCLVSASRTPDGAVLEGILKVRGGELRRRVEIRGETVTVTDQVELRRPETIPLRLHWPLAVTRGEAGGNTLRIQGERFRARIEVAGFPGSPRFLAGDPNHPGSPCRSPVYGRLLPASAWTWGGSLTEGRSARWVTTLTLERS